MSASARRWLALAVIALVVAAVGNAVLSGLSVRHDPTLVALVAAAVVAAGVLALETADAATRVTWFAPRSDPGGDRGEDTRTASHRRVIEAHLSSRNADDTVVWQIAELARRRLRQVHDLRPGEDPARTEELLGARLAGWVSQDRRHRYVPGARHPRYTVAALGDVVRRIEEL